MAPINVLITSFPGLGLPSTLCLPLSSSSTISDLTSAITARLPRNLDGRLILTTNSNKPVSEPNAELFTLTSFTNDGFLPLRLTSPLCGGKGGFGSQLRAAGGRMSKRKKQRRTQEDIEKENAWSRNLDGRRLRTVAEAKALTEYLAIKPDMDEAQKEEKRKRWEKIIEDAEKAKQQLKDEATGKGRLEDGLWADSKKKAEDAVKAAVIRAMANDAEDEDDDGEEMEDIEESESESDNESANDAGEGSSSKATTPESASGSKPTAARKVFGWDDDEDDDEDDDDDEVEDNE